MASALCSVARVVVLARRGAVLGGVRGGVVSRLLSSLAPPLAARDASLGPLVLLPSEHMVPLTGRSRAAAAAYDAAVWAYASGEASPDAGFAAALALDGDLLAARAALVCLRLLSLRADGASPEVAAHLAAARAAVRARAATPREAALVRAARLLARGAWRAAGAALDAAAAAGPCDLLLLRLRHDAAAGCGEGAALRASPAAAWGAWAASMPGYGRVAGLLAFGCSDAGLAPAAEELGMDALGADAADALALAAVVHAYELAGRREEGARLLRETEPAWRAGGGAGALDGRLAWHEALFALEEGRAGYERARGVYSEAVGRAGRTAPLELADATNLLWRMELMHAVYAPSLASRGLDDGGEAGDDDDDDVPWRAGAAGGGADGDAAAVAVAVEGEGDSPPHLGRSAAPPPAPPAPPLLVRPHPPLRAGTPPPHAEPAWASASIDSLPRDEVPTAWEELATRWAQHVPPPPAPAAPADGGSADAADDKGSTAAASGGRSAATAAAAAGASSGSGSGSAASTVAASATTNAASATTTPPRSSPPPPSPPPPSPPPPPPPPHRYTRISVFADVHVVMALAWAGVAARRRAARGGRAAASAAAAGAAADAAVERTLAALAADAAAAAAAGAHGGHLLLRGAAGAPRGVPDAAIVAGAVGLPLARALAAFARGRHADALEGLLATRGAWPLLGGCAAQRDVLALTLLHAAVGAGRLPLALALARERTIDRHSSGLAWHALGEVLGWAARSAGGEGRGAAEAGAAGGGGGDGEPGARAAAAALAARVAAGAVGATPDRLAAAATSALERAHALGLNQGQ